MANKTFVCIGDCHFPFTSEESLYGRNGIVSFIKEMKPDYVVQVGDLYDFYSWTAFPYKRDLYTPEAEIGVGREMAEEMWTAIKRASSRSRCHQLMGNHDERPAKRLMERNPEMFSLWGLMHDKLFQFPGVKTQSSERSELLLDGIMFMHGYRSKLGDHALHNNLRTVCGHSHQGGVSFVRRGDGVIWELNCGFIGDPSSVPLSYTRQRTVSRWTQGFGVIDRGPRFIPLPNLRK